MISCSHTQSRNENHLVTFEVFETSPQAKVVLQSDNALEWDFPGRAAQISLNVFQEVSFQKNMSRFLEQAAQEPLHRFAARAYKAGTSPVESRDTPDPGLLTQFLMPMLEATGQSVDTPKFRKRVRDDVNIGDAEFPWRRDPSWLALRVATQHQLRLSMGDECGRTSYKFLICAVLAQLLKDCVGSLSPGLTLVLRAKLCRRLAKLEQEATSVSDHARIAYQKLFDTVGVQCEKIIADASRQIEDAWESFKRTIERRIPLLPARASERDLYLSLPRSGEHLRNLLQQPSISPSNTKRLDSSLPPLENTAVHRSSELASRYFKLADLDSAARQRHSLAIRAPGKACQDRCALIAETLFGLLADDAFQIYTSMPDQMSLYILKAFELWVEIDKCAVACCPLLSDCHPFFPAEALDVLQLAELSSMNRLQNVQSYLRGRRDDCKYPSTTILSESGRDCFAVRYLHEDDNGRSLQQMLEEIESASSASRDAKVVEWEKACKKYDDLSAKISAGTCTCTFNRDGSRNIQGCAKCYHWRFRNRMVISIHEDFLPTDKTQKAMVIFELGIPCYLQAYRNATWKVLKQLGPRGTTPKPSSPKLLLKDHPKLKPYKRAVFHEISLASAKKSFLQTHYKEQRMKADLKSVVLPSGLSFSYYDESSKSWISNFEGPVTFLHLCGIRIPRALLDAAVEDPTNATWTDGPTSYEIVASRTRCPSHMSNQEFAALQRLLAGKKRRWMTILTELSSSHINFSDEESTYLISQLAVQAGPTQWTTDVFRDVHVIFRDRLFCDCLRKQLEKRLRLIEANWREVNCMEFLLNLALRLHALTDEETRRNTYELIKIAREATLQWNVELREKFRDATNANEAMRVSQYRSMAALLCRRTFAMFSDEERKCMDAEELGSFVKASISLQQSLALDPSKLSPKLERMLMRDMKTAHRFRSTLQASMQYNEESINNAICSAWSSEPQKNSSRRFTSWKLLEKPHDSWVVSNMSDQTQDWGAPQVVHYNVVEGHLLVNGQSMGTLPLEITESEDVRALFGNQHLLTYPSPLSGMSHVLASSIEGHEIHFGRRDKEVFIRALRTGPCGQRSLLQYVSSRLFRPDLESEPDLPAELIDGCAHWLDLGTGQLEIRRHPTIWRSRPGNWILNVNTRQALRRETLLVDPHSKLCHKINNILRGFEKPHKTTVSQPPKGRLSVVLKQMELSFFVNQNNLLECQQLQAEVDPNQDAGTLYGLESKIVLRDKTDANRRSIITGLGEVSYQRHGMHVTVRVVDTTAYGRFEIDSILGRLTCPPETLLLYSMALFHATTSFPLPDPLTASTGAESAYRILDSGYCQPWMPITAGHQSILEAIGRLCPEREYYPRDKRLLQTVQWNQNLTMAIQHDCYSRLVGDILSKSNRLQVFHTRQRSAESSAEDVHHSLRERAVMRRSLYERCLTDRAVKQKEKIVAYESRDRHGGSISGTNVYQIVKLLHRRPFTLPRVQFAKILQNLPGKTIGGFHAILNALCGSLDSLINDDIGEQWGSLVNFCRNVDEDQIYDAVFRLGLLAFSDKADMNMIRILCAFSSLQELKALQPPKCALFIEFNHWAPPTSDHIEDLVLVDLPVHEPELAAVKGRKAQFRPGHEEKRSNLASQLTKHVLNQWPCAAPSTDVFDADSIDISRAMERLQPEWTRLYNNWKLSEYLDQAQVILDHCVGSKDASKPRPWRDYLEATDYPIQATIVPSLPQELLRKPGPLSPAIGNLYHFSQASSFKLQQENASNGTHETREMQELGQILTMFTKSSKKLWQQYGDDLLQSFNALRDLGHQQRNPTNVPELKSIDHNIAAARGVVLNCFALICDALSLNDSRFRWLQQGNLWPIVSPVSLLQHLRTKDKVEFGPGMKELLVSYGTSITTLQWLLRMRRAYRRGDHAKLLDHCSENGHSNWDPMQFPDWLLLEVESDLLIRGEQIEVAKAIISPPSSSNSVLQLNMGKGKIISLDGACSGISG